MQDLRRSLDAASILRSCVLLEGPTGSGKEVVARELHRIGPRRDGPFVAENMATTSVELAESRFFGHDKGAFTGAHRRHCGAFERAHGGTLFLDEVGDTPLAVQALLLRVLQDSRVTPVGSDRELAVDVRVIAATNRPLAGLIKTKAFREDLYFRLCVSQVRVPELDRRLEDIPALLEHHLRSMETTLQRKLPAFSEAAVRELQARRWRGNVRELFVIVERTVATCIVTGVDVVEAQHIDGAQSPALPITSAAGSETLAPGGIKAALREHEIGMVNEALALAGGKLHRAAKLLGEPCSTLHSRVKRLGLV